MTDRIHRFAIAATFFVNGILFASWVTRIPDVKQGLGLDEASLGTALLAIAVGGLIAMPLAGGQAARRGSRFATIATALLSLLVVPLPVLAVGQMTLAGALLLFGACLSSLSVAMNAQAAVLEARMRRPIMSSFHGAFSLGGLVGAGIGGLIAQAGVAPLPHLLGASAFGAAVLAFALPRLLRDGPAPAAPAFALPNRVLLPFCLVAFCCLIAEGAMADWAAVFLREMRGAGAGLAAAGYSAFSLAMAVGRFSGDRLTARWGATAVLRGGTALTALGFAAAILVEHSLAALLGFAAVGLGLSNVVPVVLTAAARHGEPGPSIAAVSTVGFAGFLVGPPMIGYIAHATDLGWGLAVVAGLVLAAGLLATRGAGRPVAVPAE